MTRRGIRLVVSGTLGVLAALAANAVYAAVLTDACLSQPEGVFDGEVATQLIQSIVAGQEAGPAQPLAPGNPQDNDRPELGNPDRAPAGATATSQPNSSSSGSGATAIIPAVCALAQTASHTTLPRESRPYLPTGPPFELLRPPRG